MECETKAVESSAPLDRIVVEAGPPKTPPVTPTTRLAYSLGPVFALDGFDLSPLTENRDPEDFSIGDRSNLGTLPVNQGSPTIDPSIWRFR
jgi:hypothetical protein